MRVLSLALAFAMFAMYYLLLQCDSPKLVDKQSLSVVPAQDPTINKTHNVVVTIRVKLRKSVGFIYPP